MPSKQLAGSFLLTTWCLLTSGGSVLTRDRCLLKSGGSVLTHDMYLLKSDGSVLTHDRCLLTPSRCDLLPSPLPQILSRSPDAGNDHDDEGPGLEYSYDERQQVVPANAKGVDEL